MQSFFKSTKFRCILALCIALALGVMTAALTHDGTSPLTKAVSVVLTPLHSLSSALLEKTENFGAHFRFSGAYMKQIAELESQIADYRNQLVDYEKTLQKLESYEAFLDIQKNNTDFTYCAASVISRDGTDVYNSFTINKGSADGIAVGMPVVCGNYLVGSVRQVNPTSCTVHTVLNPSLAISAYEIRTGEEGFVTTDTALAMFGKCKLSRLHSDTAVGSGGIVCTSGLGGSYPRDLIIGTIQSIHNEETDISAYAVLEPGISITNILEVFVITSFN
ncbi:MAG: rod shape-determining protein MreC [Ruminococcaceae bacterium]|nr:rod shape-determining protein MreC [Oscillospiraceae bacterium]